MKTSTTTSSFVKFPFYFISLTFSIRDETKKSFCRWRIRRGDMHLTSSSSCYLSLSLSLALLGYLLGCPLVDSLDEAQRVELVSNLIDSPHWHGQAQRERERERDRHTMMTCGGEEAPNKSVNIFNVIVRLYSMCSMLYVWSVTKLYKLSTAISKKQVSLFVKT